MPEPPQRAQFFLVRQGQAVRAFDDRHRIGAADAHPAARLELPMGSFGYLEEADSDLGIDRGVVRQEAHLGQALLRLDRQRPGRRLAHPKQDGAT